MDTVTYNRLVEVKETVEAEWLQLPGVHGVSVGYKETAGDRSEIPAIVVHVERKRPLEELDEAERIPPEIGGFATDVLEQAMPSAH